MAHLKPKGVMKYGANMRNLRRFYQRTLDWCIRAG